MSYTADSEVGDEVLHICEVYGRTGSLYFPLSLAVIYWNAKPTSAFPALSKRCLYSDRTPGSITHSRLPSSFATTYLVLSSRRRFFAQIQMVSVPAAAATSQRVTLPFIPELTNPNFLDILVPNPQAIILAQEDVTDKKLAPSNTLMEARGTLLIAR